MQKAGPMIALAAKCRRMIVKLMQSKCCVGARLFAALEPVSIAQASLDQGAKQLPIASLERHITIAEIRAKRLMLYDPCDCRVLNIFG
jgi:hypothetical protein